MLLLVLAQLIQPLLAQQLKLAQNYSGQAFFNPWNFKTGNDATDLDGQPGNQGNVNFLDAATAQAQKLTSINAAGNVVIKVDDFTSGASDPNYGRNSVYMYSKDTFTAGTLIVLDAVHIPFGCSVWPAFWMIGLGAEWPSRGEIDIIENVNLAPHNQVSLHTLDGCTNPGAGPNQSGNVISTNCFVNATNQARNQGCLIGQSDLSFGAKFAQSGGGAFATLWDDQGIRIWFFTRSQIPADLSTPNPNPNNWGTPNAFWPQSTCDTTKFFGPQTLILETNVCGNFAVDVFKDTCGSVAPVCTDLVQDPSHYHDAYWEIKSLSIFTNGTSTGSSTSTGSGTSTGKGTSTAGGSNPTGSSSTGNNGGSGGFSVNPLWFLATAVIASAGAFIAF